MHAVHLIRIEPMIWKGIPQIPQNSIRHRHAPNIREIKQGVILFSVIIRFTYLFLVDIKIKRIYVE